MAFNSAHCGACGFTEGLHEHHIVPRTQGGLNLPTVYLCVPCHAAVHNRTWDPDHGILIKAGLAAARAEGRIGGRRKKLDPGKRKEIAESVISGRKSCAEMARLYNISAPTVSRIVAHHARCRATTRKSQTLAEIVCARH